MTYEILKRFFKSKRYYAKRINSMDIGDWHSANLLLLLLLTETEGDLLTKTKGGC